jgi:hypothetical protein
MTVKLSCTFTGSGTTPATGTNKTGLNQGPFSLTISGGVGTVQLEMATDGATFLPVSKNSDGDIASYAITAAAPVQVVGYNVDATFVYRLNVTAYTSGTITGIISQGGAIVT